MKAFAKVKTLALLALLVLTVDARQPSPAERRARELAGLINSGDRAAARVYAQANYAPAFLSGHPMDAHLGFISQVHDFTRGVEFHGVQDSGANEVTVLLKSKLTGRLEALFVRVEPEPPHRISGIGLRPARKPAGEPSRRLSDAEIVKELDAYVQKLGDADVFSGAVLLARNHKVLYKKAWGLANKDFNSPNNTETKFNLGSMNKMFTGVAIAQLVERGKLSFDDPLSKFLPDFPNKEAAEKILIKHLLTHTSGLGSYFNQKFMESSRARFRSVSDMMQLAKDDKPAFEPGTRWQYSNTGFLVLGAVIEKVTGQSYFDYVRENITRPAGMINTDCYELDRVNANLAVGYQKEFTDSGVTFRNNIFEHVIRGGPAGGGYSTVEDLLRFDMALRGAKLVGPEYVKLLLSPKPELNSPRYGYGFGIDTENNIAGHSGGFPGISSNLAMFLGDGYTAVVMSNYGGGSQRVSSKMEDLVLSTRKPRAQN
jgi:CubicO group peptidase (beta-lactamase class C family)